MQEENSGSVEGVLDVSVIVPICFENPLKEENVEFLKEVLLGKRKGRKCGVGRFANLN